MIGLKQLLFLCFASTGTWALESCKIERGWVSSFDEVLTIINPDISYDEYIILSSDCSEKSKMAILGDNLQNSDMNIKVLIGNLVISASNGQSVLVNDQEVQLPYEDEEIRITKNSEGGLKIVGNDQEVEFNGSRITIYKSDGSDIEICGLCGKHDGE